MTRIADYMLTQTEMREHMGVRTKPRNGLTYRTNRRTVAKYFYRHRERIEAELTQGPWPTPVRAARIALLKQEMNA